ncbi:MAG: hypothetical protein JWQ35_690 [Bacteriovoracaceae bacterium]|nr:hypothetical protein [Bacteriovoracaceae bacterium]
MQGIQPRSAHVQQQFEYHLEKNPGFFGRMDTNQDGSIQQDEFIAMAKNLGLDGEKVFAAMDTNKDGNIDAREFKSGFKVFKDELFSGLDKGNKGYLTEADLTDLAKKLGIDVDKVMAHLDPTGSKQISKSEFLNKIGGVLNHLTHYSFKSNGAAKHSNSDVAAVVQLSRNYSKEDVSDMNGRLNRSQARSSEEATFKDQSNSPEAFQNTFDDFANSMADQLDPAKTGVISKEAIGRLAEGLGISKENVLQVLAKISPRGLTREEFKSRISDLFQGVLPTDSEGSEDDAGSIISFSFDKKENETITKGDLLTNSTTSQTVTGKIDLFG